jgi:two-component system response regulator RegA
MDNSLLLVDDDDVMRSRLARALIARGLRVLQAASYGEAMEHLEFESPDMAVVDLRMPGKSGLELVQEVKRKSPHTRIVVLTGYGSISNAVEAVRAGAVNYLSKPADADQVLAAFDADPRSAQDGPLVDYQPLSLAQAEWNHIQRVMADCGGNLTQAARLLGIPRRTLQRKLKKQAP